MPMVYEKDSIMTLVLVTPLAEQLECAGIKAVSITRGYANYEPFKVRTH